MEFLNRDHSNGKPQLSISLKNGRLSTDCGFGADVWKIIILEKPLRTTFFHPKTCIFFVFELFETKFTVHFAPISIQSGLPSILFFLEIWAIFQTSPEPVLTSTAPSIVENNRFYPQIGTTGCCQLQNREFLSVSNAEIHPMSSQGQVLERVPNFGS